jgi:hypothetical protein
MNVYAIRAVDRWAIALGGVAGRGDDARVVEGMRP